MNRRIIWIGSFVTCLAAALVAFSDDLSEGPRYKDSSLSAVLRLGLDLRASLPEQHRSKLHAQPVSVDTDVMPFVRLEEYPDEGPMIFISVGFIDLVNNVAHAKAIDQIQRGFFRKYVMALAQEQGTRELLELPNVTDPRYWTDNTLNEQLSNFNSIVGMVVGIKLAHHYLGHYKKYAAKLTDAQGNRIPINNVITPEEWEAALAAGARNALDAGCTIEGVLPFFEAFDRMRKRPAWTAYFVPDKSKYKTIRKVLEKAQHQYFNGE